MTRDLDPALVATWEQAEQAQAERWHAVLDAAEQTDQTAATAATDTRSA